jgi:hypothetical protein
MTTPASILCSSNPAATEFPGSDQPLVTGFGHVDA